MPHWKLKENSFLNRRAYLEKPLFIRIIKSPTSWGISCTSIANTVVNPNLNELRKLEATAKPCMKLSIQFADKFKYPVIFLDSFSSLLKDWLKTLSIHENAMIPEINHNPVLRLFPEKNMKTLKLFVRNGLKSFLKMWLVLGKLLQRFEFFLSHKTFPIDNFEKISK